MEDRIRRIVTEYARMKAASGSMADSAVETAMYLEDAFGILLTDAEISSADLGSVESAVRLVVRKIGEA